MVLPILSNPLCQQPKLVGPCKAEITRYYYNTKTFRCEPFFFGGCRGNSNNFDNLEMCSYVCEKGQIVDNLGSIDVEDFCFMAPASGPCKYYFVRYYFDAITGECEDFVYGGCGGNGNNFEDIESCLRTCVG